MQHTYISSCLLNIHLLNEFSVFLTALNPPSEAIVLCVLRSHNGWWCLAVSLHRVSSVAGWWWDIHIKFSEMRFSRRECRSCLRGCDTMYSCRWFNLQDWSRNFGNHVYKLYHHTATQPNGPWSTYYILLKNPFRNWRYECVETDGRMTWKYGVDMWIEWKPLKMGPTGWPLANTVMKSLLRP